MAEKLHTSIPGAPLTGRSVVVTRSRAQAGAMVEPLEALGAEVLVVPVIEIIDPPDLQALDDAIARLPEYDWLVLTSANGVERFFARTVFTDRTAEALGKVKIAAVGRATAERMAGFGVAPHLVPADFRAEGLVAAFKDMDAGPGLRVLYARALEAREVLPTELRAMGAEVDVVAVYQTVAAKADASVVGRLREGVDAVTFTSPSTVKHFLAFLSANGVDAAEFMSHTVAASIGPVTTKALEEAGFLAGVEAGESTVPALVEALTGWFSA